MAAQSISCKSVTSRGDQHWGSSCVTCDNRSAWRLHLDSNCICPCTISQYAVIPLPWYYVRQIGRLPLLLVKMASAAYHLLIKAYSLILGAALCQCDIYYLLSNRLLVLTLAAASSDVTTPLYSHPEEEQQHIEAKHLSQSWSVIMAEYRFPALKTRKLKTPQILLA